MDTTSTSTRLRRRVANAPAPAARRPIEIDQSASQRTGVIFVALLGMAACLALAGVVRAATETSEPSGTSVDDPPPSLIVESD